MQRIASLSLAFAIVAPAAIAQTQVTDGYVIGGSIDQTAFCGKFPATATMADGSYLTFDGRNISRRSADGTILLDYGFTPGFGFATFLEVDEASDMAYFGESSGGMIRSLDLSTGVISDLAQLTFNYDFALDVVPGLAYVTASAFGSATNSLFRIDLNTGDTVQVADLGGFSGPVEVGSNGDVYVGVLPDLFPFPAGSSRIVRFDAAEVTSGALLTDELDGDDFATGFNGLSSSAYDTTRDAILVMETNTGTSGQESVLWRLDASGARLEEVARSDSYTGGVEFVDSGQGTEFGPYQPAYSSVRFSYSDCFSGVPFARIVNVVPNRPQAVFTGPGAGTTGAATVGVQGIPNGFASLWFARSFNYTPFGTIEDLGGLHPIALSAGSSADFVRRSAPVPLNGVGVFNLTYTQDAALEGAILFQWLVYDANLDLVTSSNGVINRD